METDGRVELDAQTREAITRGFQSVSVSDALTLKTIREYFESDPSYLFDPHAAVALAAALRLRAGDRTPIVCMATAHPAKFPDVIAGALGLTAGQPLPEAAVHPDLVRVPENDANLSICALEDLEAYLADALDSVRNSNSGAAT